MILGKISVAQGSSCKCQGQLQGLLEPLEASVGALLALFGVSKVVFGQDVLFCYCLRCC